MRKRTKRMLSVLMAALMVVSIMPVTGSNNIVAKASTASAESSVVTWSAADILAAQEGDSGLVLCGSGWANNNATDDKTFEDGFSALGDNAMPRQDLQRHRQMERQQQEQYQIMDAM